MKRLTTGRRKATQLIQAARARRPQVYHLYMMFFFSLFAGWACLIVASLVRNHGFPFLYGIVTEVLPAVAVQYVRDPMYILAFILGSSFLWSVPWAEIFDSDSTAPNNHFRGRKVSGPSYADLRAYQGLVRRNLRRRNRPRNPPHESAENV